jgi:hypothetical protein
VGVDDDDDDDDDNNDKDNNGCVSNRMIVVVDTPACNKKQPNTPAAPKHNKTQIRQHFFRVRILFGTNHAGRVRTAGAPP